jgi:hypothetical protein
MGETVRIEPGIQVQSIPLPGELPQVFETVTSLDARPAWNAFGAKLTRAQSISAGKRTLTLGGAGLNLPMGTRLLVMYGPVPAKHWEIVEVENVSEDYERKTTTFSLAQPMHGPSSAIAAGYPKIYTFTVEARVFGANAPDWWSLPSASKRAVLGLTDQAPIPAENRAQWPNFSIHLPALYGSRFAGRHTILAGASSNVVLNDLYESFDDGEAQANVMALEMAPMESEAMAMQSASPFAGFQSQLVAALFDSIVTADMRTSTLSLDQEYKAILGGSLIYLDDPAGKVVLEVNGAETISRSAFALSGKSTVITADSSALAPFRTAVRSLTVLGGSRELMLAEELDPTPLQGLTARLPLRLRDPARGDNFGPALPALEVGRALTLEGLDEATGVPITPQLLTIKAFAMHATEAAWSVQFDQAIAVPVHRASALFRGNVVLATHGQSRVQVLGHGDARRRWAEMALSAGPLTYVSSATDPRGVASTLEVSVDGMRWQGIDTFYGRGPSDEVFTVRHRDSGEVIVRTGDGRTGSRLPTGMNNVKAKFRTGIGAPGNLAPSRLTSLMTRPLGLQGVHQPLPASGGEDPETRDLARTNAPLTVKTFERLVSLADYTDFARCYAGIGKAQAAWAKLGLAQGIMLSVTDALGNGVPSDSPLGENFRGALARYRDPSVPVAIFDAGVVPFAVEAKLFFDERFDAAAVVAAARAALEARYAFASMQLGEAVAASAVITLLQGVSGVIGVDLDRLYRPGLEAPVKRARLPARRGHVARDGTAHPAELLVLDAARVLITAVGVTA